MTYLNWGINYLSFMPYESDLASLAIATPTGVPFFWEVSSFTGNGPVTVAGCRPAFVRMTKEELWTTALVTRSYGAQGLSALTSFTRAISDMPCNARKINLSANHCLQNPDEPRTKHSLQSTQISFTAQWLSNPMLTSIDHVATQLTMIPPNLAGKWQKNGRLRSFSLYHCPDHWKLLSSSMVTP